MFIGLYEGTDILTISGDGELVLSQNQMSILTTQKFKEPVDVPVTESQKLENVPIMKRALEDRTPNHLKKQEHL